MNRFEFVRARSVEEARRLAAEKPGAVLKAGGIDLLDHLKERLVEPPRVVDIRPIGALDGVEVGADGSLTVGPLVTLAAVAAHPAVRKTHAALAEACEDAASPQIRNVATIGGNVLQRPRCWYYRLESYRCLKKGGDVCFAVGGENRYHAIFGGGPSYAVHPSNAAVALVALDASFVLEGGKGTRTVAAADFFRPPAEDAEKENQLAPGEVLTAIKVPAAGAARSTYESVRERAAFDWPLVAAAVAIGADAGVVKTARVVLGAVAPVPWRVPRVEAMLVGRKLDEETAAGAARMAVTGAAPLSDNGYKVSLVQTLVRRTLLALA